MTWNSRRANGFFFIFRRFALAYVQFYTLYTRSYKKIDGKKRVKYFSSILYSRYEWYGKYE